MSRWEFSARRLPLPGRAVFYSLLTTHGRGVIFLPTIPPSNQDVGCFSGAVSSDQINCLSCERCPSEHATAIWQLASSTPASEARYSFCVLEQVFYNGLADGSPGSTTGTGKRKLLLLVFCAQISAGCSVGQPRPETVRPQETKRSFWRIAL